MHRVFAPALLGLIMLLPLPLAADSGFSRDYVELGHSRLDPDMDTGFQGTSVTGLSGRINAALSDHSWVAVVHDNLSSDDFNDSPRRGLEHSALLFGVGDHVTERGMWFIEAGPSFSRISGEETRRSITLGMGIRTRVSPRFELGGGPRFDSADRLRPEGGEWLMRVQGVFDVSGPVAIFGNYDYRNKGSQWRLGARVHW